MAELNQNRLSIRQQKYKENRVRFGMDKYHAARAAGYSESYCKARAYTFDDKSVFVGLKSQLIRQGCTDKRMAERLIEGLDAVDTFGKPDMDKRRKSAELILKVMGAFNDGALIDQSQHTHIAYVWQTNSDPVQPTAVSGPDSRIAQEI